MKPSRLPCTGSLYYRTVKKSLSLVLLSGLLLMSFLVSAQDYFYYYKGKKQRLTLNTEYIYVVTTNEIPDSKKLQSILGEVTVTKFDVENATQTLRSLTQDNTVARFWAEVKLKPGLSTENYLVYLNTIQQLAGIEMASPYFSNASDAKIGLSQYFMVKLNSEKDFNNLEKLAKETNTTIAGQNKFMSLWYTIRCTSESKYNALASANFFYESKLFAASEPDLMIDDALLTNDPEYPNQWGILNTSQHGGTAGLDINALEAWDITTGSRQVVVAVLDQGFEMNHPDLMGNNFGTGFDSESGTSPSLVLGSHATSCAGIIAATQNNNQGVTGVAPNARIMSVSNSLAGTPLSRQKRADGINWAWQNGAYIISNSWSSSVAYVVIDDAINNALTMGRGGLGTVVIFSAGNSNGGVEYPANSNTDIVAVGASDDCGKRIDPTGGSSCLHWNATQGSCFGTTLDVMSPGALITTTDRQGAAGYDAGDYTATFGGTSAACPFVAGVAALVLSVNPCLTHDQVEDILEQSAQKVGAYVYAVAMGRPNGTWHNEMGYGLVDAHAAVQLAQSLLPASPTFDVYSKDRPFDTGVEPNPDSGPMWISQDIWVRKTLDGMTSHENPEYKLYSPNGVYVKIRNRGSVASTCANLSLYFSKASTGLMWPIHWQDYFQVTSAGNILHGDKINTVFIPTIAPGDSLTLEIPWYPPNPTDFDSEQHHFCLLTRIESTADPMFNEQLMVGVSGNVKRNNNIAWKNVSVYDNDADATDGLSVFVRGVQRETSYINLNFFDGGFKEDLKVKFFERKGQILIHADDKFMERLKLAKLTNIEIVDNNTLSVSSRNASILNFKVSQKETFLLNLRFKIELLDQEQTLLDVIQVNTRTKEMEGGERFIIRQNKQKAINIATGVVKASSVLIYPVPATAELSVKYTVDNELMDVDASIQDLNGSNGNISLFKGSRGKGEHVEKFDVSRLKKGIYILTLKIGDRVVSERVMLE